MRQLTTIIDDDVMSFLNEQEKTATCPLHLSVFKLDDGIPKNLPAELPLKTYNVKIEDNRVIS
jgi:3-phenylpropionate/trans-cinnamate dioxygenase ferredoxin subunit